MRVIALLPFAALLGCGPSLEKQEELGKDIAKVYASSACRLYAEQACVQNQSDSCGFSISFDSRGDCSTFMWWSFLSCDDGLFQALYENEELVQACTDQMDAVDCGADPICDDSGGSVFADADCEALDDLLLDYCAGDTGW